MNTVNSRVWQSETPSMRLFLLGLSGLKVGEEKFQDHVSCRMGLAMFKSLLRILSRLAAVAKPGQKRDLAKGEGLKILSRRGSLVRIRPAALIKKFS